MNTRINILTTNDSPNSFSFIFPLLVNRRRLLDSGITLRIFTSLKDALFEEDMIFLDSKYFRSWWTREDSVYGLIRRMKRSARAVLWFDTTDSTGTPQFKVMPYVDGYYKNQILKEAGMYYKRFYGGRLISDYYHNEFGISEERESPFVLNPLDPAYRSKLFVSWNPALNDHGIFANNYSLWGNIRSRSRLLIPPRKYTARFIDAGRVRNVPIAARFGLTHARNFVKFHREMLLRRLRRYNVDSRFVSHAAYYNELGNAKLSVSPFGLGEITYKDFETIICGALLVKPDMGHVETWPDLYLDGRTYVSCKWDFSDLGDKIDHLLSSPEKARGMAAEAQDIYKRYLFNGGDEFAGRIEEIVRRHA